MNEEIKVMKDDRGVEYRCLTYTSRYTGETDVAFDIQQYMNNGNIYIGLGCNEEGYLEPFADLTVNLGDTTPNYCAYVDTNNLPDAENFIADNELGTFTGFLREAVTVNIHCICLTRINLESFVRMDLQCMRRTKESYQRISKKMKRGEKIGN